MQAFHSLQKPVYKILLLFFILFPVNQMYAQLVPHDKLPPKPNPPRLVNDLANILSSAEENQLERKLVAYNDSTSNQIAVVTVETTHGYSGDYYATELGQVWGVGGQSKFDNGVLILVSTGTRESDGSRKYFIATGYGLEGALPSITTNSIAQEFLVPNLRSGDYFEAFDQTTDAIIKAAAGEYTAPQGFGNRGESGKKLPGSLIFFIIIIVILAIMRGRGGGGGRGGGLMSRRGYRGGLAPFIIGSMLGRGLGRGGGGFTGGFGGGGGGGFGGFGGGGFGGGGSGGSW